MKDFILNTTVLFCLFCLFCLFLLISHFKLQEEVNNLPTVGHTIYLTVENEKPSQLVTYTVYNALEGQTDNSPLKTADQSKIDKKLLNEGSLRWVALSRDLLKKYEYGDTLVITCLDDTSKNGEWIIHDTMNKRFTNKIDFLMPDYIKLGKGSCQITKK